MARGVTRDMLEVGVDGTADPSNGSGPQLVNGDGSKVGRNDLCPCGSGRKFKRCHGAEA